MSSSGLQFKGRPHSNKDEAPANSNYYGIYRYCGGAGSSGCLSPLGMTGTILEYKVSKLVVYNRLLIFQNSNEYGVNIVTDAGAAGLCSSSPGSSVDFYMGISATNTGDIETVARSGVLLNDPIGDTIEFSIDMLPQPTSSDWTARFYVYLWWGNTAYLNSGGDTSNGGAIDERSFKIVKYDNDIRV